MTITMNPQQAFELRLAQDALDWHYDEDKCCVRDGAHCDLGQHLLNKVAEITSRTGTVSMIGCDDGVAPQRPTAGSPARNQYGTFQVHSATEAQARFLRRLFDERDASGKDERAMSVLAKARQQLDADQLNKRYASDAIEILLTCPVKADAPVAPGNTASEAQLGFLRKLIAERDYYSLIPADRAKVDAVNVGQSISKSAASDLITTLKVTAFAPRPAAEPKAKLEAGMYLLDGEIYKVQKAVHGSGRMYAKRLVVDAPGEKGRFVYASGIVYKLTPEHKLTKEQAQEFGAVYGVCVRCAKTLTAEDSIDRQMGPVCYGKMGW